MVSEGFTVGLLWKKLHENVKDGSGYYYLDSHKTAIVKTFLLMSHLLNSG